MLAFTKPLDFVASELLILVKSKSFVVGSSRVRWSLSGLLKKNVKVVARYSHEPASSTKASTLKDGSGSMKTSLFIENNYAGLAWVCLEVPVYHLSPRKVCFCFCGTWAFFSRFLSWSLLLLHGLVSLFARFFTGWGCYRPFSRSFISVSWARSFWWNFLFLSEACHDSWSFLHVLFAYFCKNDDFHIFEWLLRDFHRLAYKSSL